MITIVDEPPGTQVRVDGWLAGDGVAELARVLQAAAAPVRLLVRDLRSADVAGLSLLRRLADHGTPMEGLSPYLRLMLAKPASLEPPSSHPIVRPETPFRSKEE